MKTNKQITLDVEIVEKLRAESNASALIERLLKEHYKFDVEKKKDLIQMKMISLKNYSKVAKELKNEVKILQRIQTMGIDNFSIRWLRGQDFKPDTLQCAQYRRGRELSIKSDTLQEAWEVINKNLNIFEKI